MKLISLRAGVVATARNSSWLICEKVVRLLSNLVVATWVARYLGPGEFGLLAYAMALTAMFTSLASMGLDSVLVRAFVQRPTAVASLAGTAMFLRGLGAILTVGCSLVAATVVLSVSPEQREVVLPLALAALCMFADPMDALMQARLKNHICVFVRSGSLLIASALRMGLILCGATVVAFAWVQAAEAALVCMGYIALIVRSRIRPSFSWITAAELLKLSWPLIITGLLVAIYTKLDQIILGCISASETLGIYAAAIRISELWYFLPSAVMTAVFPSMVRVYAAAPHGYAIHFQRLLDLASFAAMVVCGVISACSSILTGLLYGSSFDGSATLLAILAWNGYFISIGVAIGAYLTVIGKTRFVVIFSITGAIVGLSLNLLLIPRIGAVGAAIASVAAQAGGMLLPVLCFRDVRELRSPVLRCVFPFFRIRGHVAWLLESRSNAG